MRVCTVYTHANPKIKPVLDTNIMTRIMRIMERTKHTPTHVQARNSGEEKRSTYFSYEKHSFGPKNPLFPRKKLALCQKNIGFCARNQLFPEHSF